MTHYLLKFNPFCFGADLITQSDIIKYFIFNGTIAFIDMKFLQKIISGITALDTGAR